MNHSLDAFVALAPGGGQDGRLEVQEVFGLHLKADLVVLSACETGVGSGALADVPAGDDWVGLVRAFLHAGAAHVVATLWRGGGRGTRGVVGRVFEGPATGGQAPRGPPLPPPPPRWRRSPAPAR